MNFYSQHGEDFLANKMFNKDNGFFVEIGCIDGKRFSNTLFFEERGWKGICIEAHSGYIDILKKNRPGSIIVHAAVGERDDDETTFYANSRGSLSTLDASKEKYFKEHFKEFFTGFEKQRVQMVTLNSIFERLQTDQIDILSLDIEGYEIQALKGLDLKRHRPKLMMIESDDKQHEKLLDSLILPFGYTKSICLEGNIFYLADALMENAIRSDAFTVQLLHTEHPLDKTGDKSIIKTLDFRPKKRWFSKIRRGIFPCSN